jgi:hypothetical protein
MIMTPNEFNEKITSIKTGESFVYYTGFIAMFTKINRSIRELQYHALLCGTNKGKLLYKITPFANPKGPRGLGLVCLTQKKLGKMNFEYSATKRKQSHA